MLKALLLSGIFDTHQTISSILSHANTSKYNVIQENVVALIRLSV